MNLREDRFRFDHQRLLAASDFDPAHFADFGRLVKDLRYGPASQLLLAQYNDVPYRDRLIQRVNDLLRAEGVTVDILTLRHDRHATFAEAEAAIANAAQTHAALQITGGEAWFTAEHWAAFNRRREAIAGGLAVRLVLWLTEPSLRDMATIATDLWAWRASVFNFSLDAARRQAEPPASESADRPFDTRPKEVRSRRVAELRAALQAASSFDDPRLAAGMHGELADLLTALGQLDEALRIRREEQLTVYERLGDVRSRAITQGKIADILQARGELDEALRIRQEEEIPVYERLGDVRERAVTLVKIADLMLTSPASMADAEASYREALQVFERLRLPREAALTRQRLASIAGAAARLQEPGAS